MPILHILTNLHPILILILLSLHTTLSIVTNYFWYINILDNL